MRATARAVSNESTSTLDGHFARRRRVVASSARVLLASTSRRDDANGQSIDDSRRARRPHTATERVETIHRVFVALDVHRSTPLRASRCENPRARVSISTRNCSPRARDVSDRPRRGRSMRTVRARDPSMRNSNGHVRAPFYIPLSFVSLNMYLCIVLKGGFLVFTTTVCTRRAVGGKTRRNERETTTRETATMSTPAKENSRGDGGTVKTPSSVRARGEARGTRERWGEGRRASDGCVMDA